MELVVDAVRAALDAVTEVSEEGSAAAASDAVYIAVREVSSEALKNVKNRVRKIERARLADLIRATVAEPREDAAKGLSGHEG
jgi:hypothetical protein